MVAKPVEHPGSKQSRVFNLQTIALHTVDESPRGKSHRSGLGKSLVQSALSPLGSVSKLNPCTWRKQSPLQQNTAHTHTHVVTLLQAYPVQSSIVLYLSLWAFESLILLPDWKAW